MAEFICLPTFIGGGSITYPPGAVFGPRKQPTYELVMIHSGLVDLTIDDRVTRYEAGTTILLIPGYRELWQFAAAQPTHHSWMHLGFGKAPSHFHSLMRSLPRCLPLSQRMVEIMREVQHWSCLPQSPLMLQAAGHYAISLYMAEAQWNMIGCSTHEAVTLAQQYVRQNYKNDIALADLAAYASVSIEHLCRLFQRYCQKSPMAYVWEVRIEQALRLLSSTKLPITEVAYRCGFKNPIHLHRRIKASTGLSPTQYRQRMWNSGVTVI